MKYFGIYKPKRAIFRSILAPKMVISAIFDRKYLENEARFSNSVKSIEIAMKFSIKYDQKNFLTLDPPPIALMYMCHVERHF